VGSGGGVEGDQKDHDTPAGRDPPDGEEIAISFVEDNPLPTARDDLCPVLTLHGDRDANVFVEHAHLLAEAMRAGGNERREEPPYDQFP
jgi:dipeptidyl aminopeptidase/acylaminoacyl peptidase